VVLYVQQGIDIYTKLHYKRSPMITLISPARTAGLTILFLAGDDFNSLLALLTPFVYSGLRRDNCIEFAPILVQFFR
jgi:hypothetical protein